MCLEQASSALQAFIAQDYTKARKLLDELGAKEQDGKIAHNSRLTAYFGSQCADPFTLLEQMEVAPREKKAKKEDDDGLAEADDAVLRYNRALLCYQTQPGSDEAVQELEELFERLEPLDDLLAVKICFLLADLYVQRRHYSAANAVLTHLAKSNVFAVLHPAQVSSLELEDGEEDVPVLPPKGDGPLPSICYGAHVQSGAPQKTPVAGRPETGRLLASVEYALLQEVHAGILAAGQHQLMQAGEHLREAKGLLEKLQDVVVPHMHDGESAQQAQTVGLRKLHQAYVEELRAYIDFRHGRLVPAADTLRGKELLFNAEDPRDARTCARVAACNAMVANNVGCCLFAMGKPALAGGYFQKALRSYPSKDRALYDRRAEISYNEAVRLLLAGKPAAALDGFERCTREAPSQRCWLRSAEACLELYRQSVEAPRPATTPVGRNEAPIDFAGRPLVCRTIQGPAGLRRHVLATPQHYPVFPDGPCEGTGEEPAFFRGPGLGVRLASRPDAALTYAAMCLKNVLATSKARTAPKPCARSSKASVSLEEYEASAIEDAALTKLAYVRLCQRDAPSALRCAWRLFAKNELVDEGEAGPMDEKWNLGAKSKTGPRYPSLLGPLRFMIAYVAEAMLMLGKAAAAKKFLKPAVTGSALEECEQRLTKALHAVLSRPGSHSEKGEKPVFHPIQLGGFAVPVQPYRGKDVQEDARGALYNNLAVLAIQQSDFSEAARYCSRGLEVTPNALSLMRTLVYMLCVQGNKKEALQLLHAQRVDAASVAELIQVPKADETPSSRKKSSA